MTLDPKSWSLLCRQLTLSKADLEVVRRFEEDPTGRQFLPLSEVFRNHGRHDEALELLTQGVNGHPYFAVARVVLSRELYQRGNILESWNVLDRAPNPMVDNVLAQKLRFKLGLLLGHDSATQTAYLNLKMQQGIDPEIRRLREAIESEGTNSGRAMLIADLKAKGMNPVLPSLEVPGVAQGSTVQKSEPESSTSISSRKKFILEYDLNPASRQQMDHFKVMPLQAILGVEVSDVNQESPGPQQKVELDSTTLAEIYAKQGLYGKSLAIYQRLLRMAPHNESLRLKVAEMTKLEKQQITDDLRENSEIFDKMEVVQIIDRQMRFFAELLAKVDKR